MVNRHGWKQVLYRYITDKTGNITKQKKLDKITIFAAKKNLG